MPRWLPVTLTAIVGFGLGVSVAWGVSGGGDSRLVDADARVGVSVADPEAAAGTAGSAAGQASAAPGASAVPEVVAPAIEPAAPELLPSSGFNDERYSLDAAESPWVVVNKARPLEPEDYVPDDLVTVSGVTFADGGTMRQEAADALAKMADGAAAQGLRLRGSSAYRGYERQGEIYDHYVVESDVASADTFSARQGYSEHQTGWSADLYDSAACRLKRCFGSAEAGKWVAAHGAEYGFVIRYPDGKSDITGYKYEPWHVRYVGSDLALEMRDRGAQTLEEFFGLPAAPNY